MDMHERIAAFTGRAQEEGLVDVAYTTMDSPVGHADAGGHRPRGWCGSASAGRIGWW